MKIKIYEGDTMKNCLKKLLDDKMRPATLKEVWDLRKEGKIPMQWYHTSIAFLDGDIYDLIDYEIEDYEELIAKGGRVLFVLNDYIGLDGYDNLNDNGRFVGVKD